MNPWLMSHAELDHINQPKSKEEWIEKRKHRWDWIVNLLLSPMIIILSPVALLVYLLIKLGNWIDQKWFPLPIKTKEEQLLEENAALRSQNEKLLQRVGQEGIYR